MLFTVARVKRTKEEGYIVLQYIIGIKQAVLHLHVALQCSLVSSCTNPCELTFTSQQPCILTNLTLGKYFSTPAIYDLVSESTVLNDP